MDRDDFSKESPGELVPIEFTEYPNGPMGKPPNCILDSSIRPANGGR